MRLPYTVENAMSRKVVHLYGRTLASPVSGGRTSLDLTEEQVLGEPCLAALRTLRVSLVRAPETVPVELQEFLGGLSTQLPPEVVMAAEAPLVLEPPVIEVPPTPLEIAVEAPPAVAEPVEAAPAVEDAPKTVLYTAESLTALTLKELRKLCKSLGLKAIGLEADLVQIILAYQETL